jgi:hypothetical protein
VPALLGSGPAFAVTPVIDCSAYRPAGGSACQPVAQSAINAAQAVFEADLNGNTTGFDRFFGPSRFLLPDGSVTDFAGFGGSFFAMFGSTDFEFTSYTWTSQLVRPLNVDLVWMAGRITDTLIDHEHGNTTRSVLFVADTIMRRDPGSVFGWSLLSDHLGYQTPLGAPFGPRGSVFGW